MLRVCVIGHSLIPTAIPLNVPSVQLDIIRHPGATINSLTDKLTDFDFWSRRYDGIILCRVIWGEVVHGVNPYSRCKIFTCSCIVTSLVGKKEMINIYTVAILCAWITARLFTK